MPFDATVVRVLIASPSDTTVPRRVLREALEDWNSLHGENDSVMVLPVMWERDATPAMDDRPQGIINRQLVDIADVLVGIFWTRLGTPTSEAESGTAEEIERFIEAGKPVLLYFSSEPVAPDSVDSEQHAKLAKFRGDMESRGLIDRFDSPEELRRKATAALTRTIRERFAQSLLVGLDDEPNQIDSVPAVMLLARVSREREVRGVSKSGRPQYSTRERLTVENVGTGTAEDFRFRFEAGEGETTPNTFGNDEPNTRLPPGASLEYPLMTSMGTTPQWDIVFSWTEGEAHHEARQTLR